MIAVKQSSTALPQRHSETTLGAFGVDAADLLNELRQVALTCRSAARTDLFEACAVLSQTPNVVALTCRSAARTDLFEACAVLSQTPNVARAAYAEALMKSLEQALGTAPVVYRPGVQEVSFDEAWLLRAITTARADDRSSFLFLLRARVPHASRRNLGFLILSVSERFSKI